MKIKERKTERETFDGVHKNFVLPPLWREIREETDDKIEIQYLYNFILNIIYGWSL